MMTKAQAVMTSLFKEPLLHFLILAVGMFGLHSAVSHEDPNADAKRIVVDRDSLLTFIQYRTKSFEPVTAQRQLDGLSEESLRKLIDDYVREEALYREARNLGLDRDDYVIKRRLIQKVDYVARGFAESFGDITEEDVRAYFAENRQDYFIEPRITFTHVFYSAERHGADAAMRLARQKLDELRQANTAFPDASKHGERFLYGMNYVERSRFYVESHFGPQMAAQVFTLEPADSVWRGPIASRHGAHLVMVTQKQPGRMPGLEEVKSRVTDEAQRALIAERAQEAAQQIVDSYDVDIVYERPEDEVASAEQEEPAQ
ncbi:MAG: peptidyl-prolyl cis-trans isomerase [Rhodospirillales bacterium]|nr:MAG: peptidyl-prolyl cis-trans isomerase [Rhodospirillales bacterium]